MSYEIREKMEGHKRIVPEGLEECALRDKRYRLFNRHRVRQSDSEKIHREWFDTGSVIDIRQLNGLVKNLKRNGSNFCIWYDRNSYQDLQEFEAHQREKKEEYIPAAENQQLAGLLDLK